MFKVLSYHPGTFIRAQRRGVNFKVIDARDVDFLLPQAHWRWHRCTGCAAGVPARGLPSFHDHLDWAAHTHEQDRQAA
jgi:hypothetical protein